MSYIAPANLNNNTTIILNGVKMRKTTSIKIEAEIWDRAKKHVIDKKLTMGEYVELLFEKDMKKAHSSSSLSSSA